MANKKNDVIYSLLDPIMDNMLSEIFLIKNPNNDIDKIDLTTDEGFNKYNNLVDQLDELASESPFLKHFIDDETIESLRKFGEGVYERANEPDVEPDTEPAVETNYENCNKEKESCDMNCIECELDYCTHPEVIDDEAEIIDGEDDIKNINSHSAGTYKKELDNTSNEIFSVPSERIKNIDTKMQIHHLTQKYVDEMIKPYLGKEATNKQINDAYSALYEFACWIYTQ